MLNYNISIFKKLLEKYGPIRVLYNRKKYLAVDVNKNNTLVCKRLYIFGIRGWKKHNLSNVQMPRNVALGLMKNLYEMPTSTTFVPYPVIHDSKQTYLKKH